MKLTKNEKSVLILLIKNPLITNKDIAKKLKIRVETLYRKIKKFGL